MRNSYQGYWFSCEPTYSDSIGSVKWVLLLESKADHKVHSVGLDSRMTFGEATDMAYKEIEELVDSLEEKRRYGKNYKKLSTYNL